MKLPAFLRKLLVRLGVVAPTYAEAVAPMLKIRDNLVAARDAHNRSANEKRSQARTLERLASLDTTQAAKASEAIEKLNAL